MTKRVTRIIGLIGIGLASLDAVGAPRDSTVEINGLNNHRLKAGGLK